MVYSFVRFKCDQHQKRKKLMLRTILFTLTLTIGGLISTAVAQTDEFNLDQTYSIASGGTIHLQSDEAEVRIISSDRQDVRVVVYYKLTVRGITFGRSNQFEMIVEERNGNLDIREKDRNFGSSGMIGMSDEEYTIDIETPRDVNLDIKGDDGEYQITGIDGYIHMDADDSDAQISDVNGDDFSFSLDDGDLVLDGGNGRLRIQADDGDIQIHNGNFSEIDVDSDDSDIEITSDLYDDGAYRVDIDDADFTFNISGGGGEFDIRHDDSDISTSREFENIRDDEDYSVFKLMGGSAKVTIRSDDGDINLRVF